MSDKTASPFTPQFLVPQAPASQDPASQHPIPQGPTSNSSIQAVPPYAPSSQASQLQLQASPYTSVFPPTFGFYVSSWRSRWSIRTHKEDAPLFEISVHSGLSGKPDIVLSSSGGQGVNASANMHSFSSTTDVSINGISSAFRREGYLKKSYLFSVPGRDGFEGFEWKRGKGPEVSDLGGRRGMELVRQRTGQVVAVWAHVGWSVGKKGKMAWSVGSGELGEMGGLMLEVIAVLVVLCVLEKERRAAAASGGGGG